jgi:hypothetical protein
MLEQVLLSALAHIVDPPNPHSQGTTPLQTSRQHRIFILSPKPFSHNGSTRELRPEATACADHCPRGGPAKRHRLLRHESDRPTSVPGLLRPTRYVAIRTLHAAPRFLSLTDTCAQVSGQPGQAVSLYTAANTELTSGEITATSNNPEKRPPKSLGRHSTPLLLLLRTQRLNHNIPAPTQLLDNCSVGME